MITRASLRLSSRCTGPSVSVISNVRCILDWWLLNLQEVHWNCLRVLGYHWLLSVGFFWLFSGYKFYNLFCFFTFPASVWLFWNFLLFSSSCDAMLGCYIMYFSSCFALVLWMQSKDSCCELLVLFQEFLWCKCVISYCLLCSMMESTLLWFLKSFLGAFCMTEWKRGRGRDAVVHVVKSRMLRIMSLQNWMLLWVLKHDLDELELSFLLSFG